MIEVPVSQKKVEIGSAGVGFDPITKNEGISGWIDQEGRAGECEEVAVRVERAENFPSDPEEAGGSGTEQLPDNKRPPGAFSECRKVCGIS
jgi:hypothetical protein